MADHSKIIESHRQLLATLKAVVAANDEFRNQLPSDWGGDALNDECEAAKEIIATAEAVGRLLDGKLYDGMPI